MTEGVVDTLEAIEIDEEGSRRRVGETGPGQHLFGAIKDQAPVGETGQWVMQGLEADLVDQPGVAWGSNREHLRPTFSGGSS
jgi:hypothetical protein